MTIPDTRVCAVAGIMAGGADCVTVLSQKRTELTLDELITFLEPTDKRGAAICMSASDYMKQKIALEQACRKLGGACSKEIQATMAKVTGSVESLGKK